MNRIFQERPPPAGEWPGEGQQFHGRETPTDAAQWRPPLFGGAAQRTLRRVDTRHAPPGGSAACEPSPGTEGRGDGRHSREPPVGIEPGQAPIHTPGPAKLPLKLKAQTPNTKPKTKTPAKAPAKFPVPPKAQAPRQRPTASQRRSDDRTMLSGAIRAPHGSEPVEPKLKGKANTEDSKPIPARSFSGRLLVLSLVLAVFAVMLVPTIGIYTRQRAEISDLRASIADKQVEQQELKDQIARWDDPLYIKQQARDRINLVMPGERNYMVIGSSATSPEAEPVNESPEQVRTDLPWVDALWDTVQRAATD